MDKNPNQELKEIPSKQRWERTLKNNKFLKKPTNKTAKKQFFKELLQNSVVPDPEHNEPPKIDGKILSDLETCAKILEVVDLSKQLDLEVVALLSETLCIPSIGEEGNEVIEIGFEYARHGLIKLFFEIFIKLREKAMAGEEMPTQTSITLLGFFNVYATLKRGRKLLRNTENFDVISQPQFFESIFFNSKNPGLSVSALWFSVEMLSKKSFTQDFVEKYVDRIREIFPTCNEKGFNVIQSISQKLLESEQGNFFQKLLSELPEKETSKIAAEDKRQIECFIPHHALMRCAKCEKIEKSVTEFQKCSRCNSVYYCSKTCQKADWPSHKNVCK